MLVLTRRLGEEIVIGDMVRVTIVAIENQRVKVGITAPSQVTVHREEVHQRLQDSVTVREMRAKRRCRVVGIENRPLRVSMGRGAILVQSLANVGLRAHHKHDSRGDAQATRHRGVAKPWGVRVWCPTRRVVEVLQQQETPE